MSDQGKEIPSPQPQEVVKSSGELKRVQNGLRVALAGVAFGAWSIGVANAYAQSVVQESDKQFSIRHQESSQDYRLEFEQKPISQRKPPIETLMQISAEEHTQNSERINIPQRSVKVEDLDQIVSNLQQQSISLRKDLNQLSEVCLVKEKEVKNNPSPDYIAAKNAEVNSLNQVASSLEKFKADIEIMEQDLNKDDRKPKAILDRVARQVETAKQNFSTQSQILQKELAERFSSVREQELLRRANGETINAMNTLQKAGPDKNNQADENLKLAQEQKNLMEHHFASLHHDADIIKSYLEKGNLPTKEEIKTLSEHAQERTKWFLKYWQLEQQRANLKLDPEKNETTHQGKNYHQWVEYEIREAENQQKLYLNPETIDKTPEGAFLSSYLQFDEVRKNEIRVGIQFNTAYPNIVNSQRKTLESLKNFIDREWAEINNLPQSPSNKISVIDGDSLATDLKAYALARAWREMHYWSYQAERVQILSDQFSDFKEAEDRAEIAEAHLRQLLGGHNFSSEGDLVEGLKPLAAKLLDENFTPIPEHAFLQAHQNRIKREENQFQELKYLKDKIGELTLKTQSSKVEVKEWLEIRDVYRVIKPPVNLIKQITTGIDQNSMYWVQLYPQTGELRLNVFGDVETERYSRLKLALEELRSQDKGEIQNAWAKDRIAAYKKLYSFTDAGKKWLDTLDFRQMVGEPGFYGAGGGKVKIGQAAEIKSNLHEIGHAFFQRQSFSVSGHPQLSWNGYFDYGRNADRSRMSTAYRQYLDDVDAVKNSEIDLTRYDQDPQGVKESGNEQAIRNWLRIMTKNERPDKYHSAEADWLTAVGGNINLYKGTPFEKYFDQFLAPGDFKSFRELASWIQLSLKERSPLDQEKFIKLLRSYYNHDMLNTLDNIVKEKPAYLIGISSLRKAKLDGIFAQKKAVIEQEEKQELSDFGDQLPMYVGKEWVSNKPGAYWLYYQEQVLGIYRKFPDFLGDSHPTAQQYLDEVIKSGDYSKTP